MIKKMLKKRKGFTLTELIVVVTILGILTAVAVPLVTSYISDAEEGADNSNATNVEGVIKRSLASRSLSLTSTTLAADIIALVQAEMGAMPNLQQGSTYKFYVNTSNGSVVASDSSANAAAAYNTKTGQTTTETAWSPIE